MKFENFAVEKQIIFNVLEEKRLDIIESWFAACADETLFPAACYLWLMFNE